MGFRFFVDGLTVDKETPSYRIAVGTTDGEFSVCSLVTRIGQSRNIVPAYGTTKDTRCVHTVVQAHAGCVSCVQRHPTISDVYLTCGDRTFKVWREGLTTPLYTSPYFEEPVTCAAWSPVRPAIVFIGTFDGKIEVWDLLDRNVEALLVHHMVQDAITSLTFKPAPVHLPPGYNQHLAVGTALGSFHWYVLPSVLSKSSAGEKRLFRRMLEREVRRAHYYAWRWHEREAEYERYGASAPKMLSHALDALKDAQKKRDKQDTRERTSLAHAFISDGQPPGHKDPTESAEEDLEQYYEQDDDRDTKFLDLVKKLNQLEEERMRNEVSV
ncbi:hypothetical protein STCU_10379 [Strigomonas culicis]|uniref:Uncharacterized protein n=1 Tax=Strigomonas culicis TaxID=28005 RepID=S9UTE5_9TRYP|nr:hypothetical protein STCU_10379 [Strigomonas culicis]|eukprot:EPY17836.1 hypothetical protein STCU_10379 [Strigomonas culicis]